MEINPNHAIKTLRDVDRQLREQVKLPETGPHGAVEDSVEIGGGALGSGPIHSPSAEALYRELSAELSSLTDLVGDAAAQQKKLGGFLDAGNEDAVQKRAQELLEGYFNVENTANRIFNFAFSFFDGAGDRETFAREMQGHIHEGFRQAEKQLGGLADISLETRDFIDGMIEDFINEDKKGAGETEDQVA